MKKVIWILPLLLVFGLYLYTERPLKPSSDTSGSKTAETESPEQKVHMLASGGSNIVLDKATTEELERLALNPEEQGDTRAEAIEKLSQSPDDHALETLTQIAARTLPQSGGGLYLAQERVFAAMAIEGILNHPSKERQRKSIEAILKKQSDQFIVTRAQMALGFIKGLTPHPKEVDEKNLTNLFE